MQGDLEASGAAEHIRLLRAIRKKHGWSQRELANKLSVSKRTIQNWEYGISQPNVRDYVLFDMLLNEDAA